MISAALQLVGGDGVKVDTEEAINLFRKVIGSLPWWDLYDRYVQKNLSLAFLKFLDFGLIPPKWIDIETQTESVKAILNFIRKNLSQNYERIRKAEQGDDISVLWMALNSGFLESLNWDDKLKQMKPSSFFVGNLVSFGIYLKFFVQFCAGYLDDDDKEFFL
jgi:hypothetical protein